MGLVALPLLALGAWWMFGASKRVDGPGAPSAVVARAAAPSEAKSAAAAGAPALDRPLNEGSVQAATERPASEDAFLAELDRLAVSDKARALDFAEAGELWYSDQGVRAEARRAMRITLLVDLERMTEARSHVRTFIERYPTSRYRPLVQGVTGIHPRPPPPAEVRPPPEQ